MLFASSYTSEQIHISDHPGERDEGPLQRRWSPLPNPEDFCLEGAAAAAAVC